MVTEHGARRKKHIRLHVNGKGVEAEIDNRTTLAELLRERLDLTGTKVGCNRGECGCCTVILDGNSVYSCTVLAVEAAGKQVLTIEGLGSENLLHPLQQAFIDHDALQCGYCTPGMLLSLHALMQRNPSPSEVEVRTAVEGNICRCGSYPNIVAATLDAVGRIAVTEGASHDGE